MLNVSVMQNTKRLVSVMTGTESDQVDRREIVQLYWVERKR